MRIIPNGGGFTKSAKGYLKKMTTCGWMRDK